MALRARNAGIPCIAFRGQIPINAPDIFTATFSIPNGPMSLDHCIKDAEALLEAAVYQVAKVYSLPSKV